MTLMRKTLKECKARGERTQDAGFKSTNARILNGGWYEKRASDLTLSIVRKKMVPLKFMHAHPSIVVIVYWKRYCKLQSDMKA